MIVHESFAATDDAPCRARELLGHVLDQDPRAGVAQLAVSELVTNAVIGGLTSEDQIEVGVALGDGAMRVCVVNDGDGLAAERPYGERGMPGGWGLTIVASVASDWGSDRNGGQTRVWFEL